MHIVVNARFLTQSITGVQRFAIEVCLKLKDLVDDIEFVTSANVAQQEVFDALDAKIIGKFHGHLWEQIDLPQYLKRKGAPLLINLANTAPLFYKNKVVTIHDVAYKVFPQTYPKSFLMFYSFMIPKLLYGSKHVITVSEFSKYEICKFYSIPKKKVSVVYNAVSESFTPKPTADSNKYFLAVSSMNYRKNFIYILEAFTMYQKQGGKESLYIIGDLKNKSFKEIDLSQYKNNTQIKFLGRVSDEDLIVYYSNALAFIYPSFYEGFGIPPLEAQACGCPAVCADVSCLPEIFGDSVLYCDPYHAASLVEVMITLASDTNLCQHQIEKGKKNLSRYSWKKSADQLMNVIKIYQGCE
ncbi:glycosyltransferase family 4 protein [Candidatus Bacteroides intestinigallinarum]|uniref:glycosyltransferase family 4 protein n=1 Tax=Candidatus Bacteroides intestinigallinarum TaxID=2838470 RepID=UPI0021665F91|nr:glycosyltransferase family 1 protein [Candidatus Bacteroides intestinigallinarum]MCS3178709.1 glycosyltransferase family 4 protein [Candidatus Bacteroides intestinigallinarum]